MSSSSSLPQTRIERTRLDVAEAKRELAKLRSSRTVGVVDPQLESDIEFCRSEIVELRKHLHALELLELQSSLARPQSGMFLAEFPPNGFISEFSFALRSSALY